jgi:deoxyribodipyrimidine photo-lyase
MEAPKEYEKQSLTWPEMHKNANSWIITEEDCDLFSLAGDTRPKSIFALQHQEPGQSTLVQGFRNAAVLNAAEAAARHFDCELVVGPADDIPAWTSGKTVATSLLPVGPIRTALGRLDAKIVYIARDYDRAVWPHATAGFFKVKKKIPTILSTLGIEYS